MRRLKAWEKRRIFLLDNANCQYEGIASEFGLDERPKGDCPWRADAAA